MKSWKRMVALSGVLMLLTGSVQGESPATLSNLPVEVPEAPSAPSIPAPVAETAAPEATSAITPEPSALPSTAPASNVGTDIHGLPIPLNPQGMAELDAMEQAARSGLIPKDQAAAVTINLNLGDAVIYRSGTYTVTGGELRPGGKIILAANRVVNLVLKQATVDEITLRTGAQLLVKTSQVNTLQSLRLEENAAAEWAGNGAATVLAVTRHHTALVKVTSGSLQMNTAVEKKTCTPFPAGAVTTAQVNGSLYATIPHPDGHFYVWLPAPDAGLTWESAEIDGVLEIAQGPVHSEGTPQAIIPGTVNVVTQPGIYTISGAQVPGTLLQVAVSGVTLILENVTLEGFTGPLVDNQAPGTRIQLVDADLSAAPQSIIGHSFVLQGSGHAGTMPGSFLLASNPAADSLMMTNTPAGAAAYQLVTPESGPPVESVLYEGTPVAFIQLADGRVYVPGLTAAPGAVHRQGNVLHISQSQPGETILNLNEPGPHQSMTSPSLRIVGSGNITSTALVGGATTLATVASSQFLSSMPILTAQGVPLTLRSQGDSALDTDGSVADALQVQGGGSIQVEALSGRLSLTQGNLTGISLRGNVRVSPDPGLPHPVLTVLDRDGQPVRSADVELAWGGRTYQLTTWDDGTLSLWGMGSSAASSVALRNRKTGEIYTGLWQGDTPVADPGITFTGLQVTEAAGGMVTISFDAPTAATAGILYAYAATAFTMPDTLNFGGQVVYAAGGKVTIGPIPAGQVLSYRLFGAITPGAQLTTATEDAFSFSPPLNYTMGARIWRPGKSLDVTYTGAPYQLPVAPPQGVTLTYQGEGLNGAGLPVQVGTYTLRVTVPAGHPFYTPGTTDYPFRIRRIQLMIRPDPNQEKYEGMDDPDEFTYTVSGLLPGDNVTGTLTRKPGEEPGNYEFRTSRLSAPSYYRLMIPDDSPQFTILPGGFDEDFFPFFPGYFDILRPIHQIVVKNDGTKLDVLLNASETLQINYTRLGNILFGPDDAPRLVSPSLSWNKDTDQVLLRLMADAEINEDKGYQTDITGKPLWTRRKLLLTWLAVRGLQNTGMDAVSLQNKGAALSVSFQDLLGKRVADFIQAKGGSTKTARFALTIAPASDLTEAEQAAADHLNPVSATYRVSCQVLLGGKAYDIAHLLPSLHVSMEMESIAANLKRLNMYSADQFARQFQLTRMDEEKTSRGDSTLITPFGEDELKQVPYPALMMTRRYLTAPLTAPGLVQVTRNPDAPQPSPAAGASPAPAGTKAP